MRLDHGSQAVQSAARCACLVKTFAVYDDVVTCEVTLMRVDCNAGQGGERFMDYAGNCGRVQLSADVR